MKAPLEAEYGQRLRGLVLFGSEVRGDADRDSDIDVLVLLAGPVELGRELTRCVHVLYPLVLELGRPIDVIPVDSEAYEAGECPLYRSAKAEGIAA